MKFNAYLITILSAASFIDAMPTLGVRATPMEQNFQWVKSAKPEGQPNPVAKPLKLITWPQSELHTQVQEEVIPTKDHLIGTPKAIERVDVTPFQESKEAEIIKPEYPDLQLGKEDQFEVPKPVPQIPLDTPSQESLQSEDLQMFDMEELLKERDQQHKEHLPINIEKFVPIEEPLQNKDHPVIIKPIDDHVQVEIPATQADHTAQEEIQQKVDPAIEQQNEHTESEFTKPIEQTQVPIQESIQPNEPEIINPNAEIPDKAKATVQNKVDHPRTSTSIQDEIQAQEASAQVPKSVEQRAAFSDFIKRHPKATAAAILGLSGVAAGVGVAASKKKD